MSISRHYSATNLISTDIELVDVVLNGVLLKPNVDYIIIPGFGIELTFDPTVDDVIDIFVYDESNLAVTPTATPTSTVTPTNTPTNTLTPTNTPTNTETPAQTPTNTPTPTLTPTSTKLSITPTSTPTSTIAPTPQFTATPTRTQTCTPSCTPTSTPPPTNTPTNTKTPSNTPSITPTNTQTPSNTPTNTQTPSNTPTNTQTPSNTPTNTQTPSNTPTNTQTPTNTPTNTQTPTNTPTNTQTPTNTPTTTQTQANIEPSVTPTNTPTITPTPTTATSCASAGALVEGWLYLYHDGNCGTIECAPGLGGTYSVATNSWTYKTGNYSDGCEVYVCPVGGVATNPYTYYTGADGGGVCAVADCTPGAATEIYTYKDGTWNSTYNECNIIVCTPGTTSPNDPALKYTGNFDFENNRCECSAGKFGPYSDGYYENDVILESFNSATPLESLDISGSYFTYAGGYATVASGYYSNGYFVSGNISNTGTPAQLQIAQDDGLLYIYEYLNVTIANGAFSSGYYTNGQIDASYNNMTPALAENNIYYTYSAGAAVIADGPYSTYYFVNGEISATLRPTPQPILDGAGAYSWYNDSGTSMGAHGYFSNGRFYNNGQAFEELLTEENQEHYPKQAQDDGLYYLYSYSDYANVLADGVYFFVRSFVTGPVYSYAEFTNGVLNTVAMPNSTKAAVVYRINSLELDGVTCRYYTFSGDGTTVEVATGIKNIESDTFCLYNLGEDGVLCSDAIQCATGYHIYNGNQGRKYYDFKSGVYDTAQLIVVHNVAAVNDVYRDFGMDGYTPSDTELPPIISYPKIYLKYTGISLDNANPQYYKFISAAASEVNPVLATGFEIFTDGVYYDFGSGVTYPNTPVLVHGHTIYNTLYHDFGENGTSSPTLATGIMLVIDSNSLTTNRYYYFGVGTAQPSIVTGLVIDPKDNYYYNFGSVGDSAALVTGYAFVDPTMFNYDVPNNYNWFTGIGVYDFGSGTNSPVFVE